jgi:hypothetical protein
MTKYGNRKIEIDGYLFDSHAEARRYQELTLLEKCGDIADLEIHPKYKIVVNQKTICTYSADFRYRMLSGDGRHITEDVKGVKTAVYQLKKRLMLACYGIEISEVTA